MPNLSKLFTIVQDILLTDWDPIGVRDVAAARDEYDQYADTVAGMLMRGASTADVANYLLRIEADIMGLPADRGRAQQVANKLRILS